MNTEELEPPLFIPNSHDRSPGLHVSSIIRCIAMEEGLLTAETKEDFSLADVRNITDPLSMLRINIGLAWEAHYIPNVLGPELGVLDHPGEMQIEGVYMTHDGESVSSIVRDGREGLEQVIHEVKATYKSCRGPMNGGKFDIRNQWMWLSQTKAYCKALKAVVAELHVLFIAGDYTYPIRPQLKRYRISYTAEEIESNWRLLKDYAEYRLGEEI